MPEFAHNSPAVTAQVADEAETSTTVGPMRTVLAVEFLPDKDREVVVVRGEVDLAAGPQLQHVLRMALSRSALGIDLDLSGVGFFDCSGLNILLGVRKRALDDAKTVRIRAASPAVTRLLALAGAESLFDSASPDRPAAPAADGGDGAQDGATEQDLRIEMVQLRRALQTRPTIDLARGILMASFELSSDEAWQALVSVSQNTNTKLHGLAQVVVDTIKGDALPEHVMRHLSAAISTVQTEPPPPQPPPAADGTPAAS
ncbi:ANTAR domain-containing protein [Streptomyces monticola]|uniref:ANTAR domain-containing protein n=1 Tax=Streptomyces monticola TaxID=2666263 RepID=A0ABW2JFV9_9ACTN